MLQGILYDMAHNGVWGSIALMSLILLLVFCALYIVLCFIHKIYCSTYNLDKLKRFLVKGGKVRKVYIVIFRGLVVMLFFSTVAFAFCDWRVEKHNYVYITSSLAVSMSSEILFIKEIDYKKELWDQAENVQKLHISTSEPISEITQEIVEARMELFDYIYQTGGKVSGNNQIYTAEKSKELAAIRSIVSSMESKTLEEYEQEFEYWCELYKYYEYPSYLYQSSRAARDMLEVGRYDMDDQKLLKIASEAVYQGEIFLKYANRNINSKEQPIIKEAGDIAFLNGKVYYQLYMLSLNRENLRQYDKEFLVNAYVCMKQAKGKLTEDSVDYAKINYYIGNICEKMLEKIPNGSVYYMQMAEESLQYYNNAMRYLSEKDNYYSEESFMLQNIQNGIRTVESLLGK